MITKVKYYALEIAKEMRKMLYLGILMLYLGMTFTVGVLTTGKLSGVAMVIAVTADEVESVEHD